MKDHSPISSRLHCNIMHHAWELNQCPCNSPTVCLSSPPKDNYSNFQYFPCTTPPNTRKVALTPKDKHFNVSNFPGNTPPDIHYAGNVHATLRLTSVSGGQGEQCSIHKQLDSDCSSGDKRNYHNGHSSLPQANNTDGHESTKTNRVLERHICDHITAHSPQTEVSPESISMPFISPFSPRIKNCLQNCLGKQQQLHLCENESEAIWIRRFKLLLEYKRIHNNCCVPQKEKWRDGNEVVNLGVWVNKVCSSLILFSIFHYRTNFTSFFYNNCFARFVHHL